MMFYRVFETYDTDGDGFISAHDLQKSFAYKGRTVDPKEIKKWISIRDSSNSGKVSFRDFCRQQSM